MSTPRHDFFRQLGHLWRSMKFLLSPLPSQSSIYAGYDKMRQFYIMQQMISHFKRRLDDPAPLLNQTVLDVGCGESSIGAFLVLSGAEVTAIDQNAQALTTAQNNAKTYGTDMTFVHGKVEDFIHSSEVYDVIICLDLFEYLDDINKFIWVIKRLLKPEGVLVFSSINRAPLAWFIHIFLSSWVYRRTPRGSRKYKQFYTPVQLENILKKQGLYITHTQGMAFNTQDKQWQLSKKISTRYMGTAALHPPAPE